MSPDIQYGYYVKPKLWHQLVRTYYSLNIGMSIVSPHWDGTVAPSGIDYTLVRIYILKYDQWKLLISHLEELNRPPPATTWHKTSCPQLPSSYLCQNSPELDHDILVLVTDCSGEEVLEML